MVEEIDSRFRSNLLRVRALVAVYRERTGARTGGIDVGVVLPYGRLLASLMSRRHQIVHRADRHEGRGSGHHAAASLSHAPVARWIAAVEGLGGDIVAALRGVGHAS